MGVGRHDNAYARRDDRWAWGDDDRAWAWGDVAVDRVAVAIGSPGKPWTTPHCDKRHARLPV